MPVAATTAAQQDGERGSERASRRLERAVDGGAQPRAILVRVDGADERLDDLPLAVEDEGLRESRSRRSLRACPRARRRRPGTSGRTARMKLRASRRKSFASRPTTTSPPRSVLPPDLLEERRLLLARDAPRRPDVEHDRLAPERRERELALLVEPLEREVGRPGRSPRAAAAARSPPSSVDERPDEQGEEQRDEPDGDALGDEPARAGPSTAHRETMKTGVPTFTCRKSHSASGIRIRMQPCEAE